MLHPLAVAYARDVLSYLSDSSTTEETYYPAIRDLWKGLLEERGLAFQVRTGTSETRQGAEGVDRPDIAVYDRDEFVVALGEVKTPDVALRELAASTDRNDQIGRYLASTGVVLLCNVRSVGLVACKPGCRRDPASSVPVADRDLLATVDLWPEAHPPRHTLRISDSTVEALADLLERAVTEFAPIGHPSSLARILARQARRAKDDLPEKFESVKGLLEDYRLALGLSFEDKEGADFFRSSLIQTAYYALFAGWTLWHRTADGTPFEWERIDRYLKIPFLGKLFYEFRHPDRLAELGLAQHLDRATATLNRVDRSVFFAGFTYTGLQTPEDTEPQVAAAITYFYEPFLEAFDPDLRKSLGVWYTPPEIVRYQVRKVESLLHTLGCRQGYADERVVVLDPCCGTGAYLLEVVRRIAEVVLSRGDDSILATELLEAVSRRIIGFEILTAPFVIAQLQLYALLSDLGVTPSGSTRPAVFLTNALTGWEGTEQVKLNFPELQDEHDSARNVKKSARIIVVLGNPPYNRFAGIAMDEEADLVDRYKGIRRRVKKDKHGKAVLKDGRPVLVQDGESELYSRWGIRKQLLDDLYIRFFRLAEKRIGEVAEHGVVSFISNSSYLTGRSHPIMRESILTQFDEVWIDNMHGNRIASERTPWGESCETLFSFDGGVGVKVGISISTFLKHKAHKHSPGEKRVHFRDFWGRADLKRKALLGSLRMADWAQSEREQAAKRPEGPRDYETIKPSEAKRWMLAPKETDAGFEAWPALDELFPTSFQGVNTNRGLEGSVVDVDRDSLAERMAAYFNAGDFARVATLCPALAVPRAGYDPEEVWRTLRSETSFSGDVLVPYLMFPLDAWWVYYEAKSRLLNRRRPEFWENLHDNEFLVSVPQPRRVSETRPMLARTLVDLHLHDRGSVCFPRESSTGSLVRERAANLAHAPWLALRNAWGMEGELTGTGPRRVVAQLFRLTLAIMHSPQYEQDHADALAQDWAHLPIPRDRAILDELAVAGDQVAVLLDPAADAAPTVEAIVGKQQARRLGVLAKRHAKPILQEDLAVEVSYYGAASGKWAPRAHTDGEEKLACWGGVTGDVAINSAVRFMNVPERVWRYELGGYPVLKKWLGYRHKDRRAGRPLSLEEAKHFRSMVHRLAALLVLQSRLDELYARASAAAFTAEELGLRQSS